MTSPQNNPNAVLALAQYAYTRLEPLFAQAKTVYPELEWTIQLTFADAASKFSNTSHLNVYNVGTPEFYSSSHRLTDMEDVDDYAAQLADDVANITAEVTA
jgi:hypothetical protein